jgi:hypothetical protein
MPKRELHVAAIKIASYLKMDVNSFEVMDGPKPGQAIISYSLNDKNVFFIFIKVALYGKAASVGVLVRSLQLETDFYRVNARANKLIINLRDPYVIDCFQSRLAIMIAELDELKVRYTRTDMSDGTSLTVDFGQNTLLGFLIKKLGISDPLAKWLDLKKQLTGDFESKGAIFGTDYTIFVPHNKQKGDS